MQRFASHVIGLATRRGLGVPLQVAALALAGRSLVPGEQGRLFVGLALAAWTLLLGGAGLLPMLLRRFDEAALRACAAEGRYRALVAAVLFAALGSALLGPDPALLGVAALHLLLPLQLAAAAGLRHGRTGALARAELQARILGVVLAAAAWLAGLETAGPWWVLLLLPSLLPGLLLALAQPAAIRRALLPWGPTRRPRAAPTRIAAGELLRATYFQGGLPIVHAVAGAAPGFGAAFTLHRVGVLLPSALATTVQGPLSRGAPEAARDTLRRLLPSWLGLGAAGAVIAWVAARPVLELLFPTLPALDEAVASLRVLALAVPALFGAGLCLPYLLARDGERAALAISTAALATWLVLLLALAPTVGPRAGAIALSATEWLVFVLALAAVRRGAPVPAPRGAA
ncbi:MAG: hypothetical protein R3F30_08800 [Planctomycetota bacterium]